MARVGKILFAVLSLPILLIGGDLHAYGIYRVAIPNGDRYGCTLCHQDILDTSGLVDYPLNNFGLDVRKYLRAGNYTKWTTSIARVDSDLDGYTNGEELQQLEDWEPIFLGEDLFLEGDDIRKWNLTANNRLNTSHPGDADFGAPRVRFEPLVYPDTIQVGEELRVPLSGSTSAFGRTVSFEFPPTTPPPDGATISNDTFTWTPAFEQGGSHVIQIRMTDGTTVVVRSIRVGVKGGQVPPDPPVPPVVIPPPTPVTAYGAIDMDFDHSRKVDFTDFLTLIGLYGQRSFSYDFDRDGRVGFRDLLYFAHFYGQTVVTEEKFVTPALDTLVYEPAEGGVLVYQNPDNGLFEQAQASPFLIGKYEVTTSQYLSYWEYLGRAADRTPSQVNGVPFPSYAADHPTLPVTGVDFADAKAYCAWAGGHLPTWAEWVTAAIGENQRTYAHGDLLTKDSANFYRSDDPYEPGATPVGFYDGREESGFQTADSRSVAGAYDMTGNVWEWVDHQHDAFGQTEASVMGGSFDDDDFGTAFEIKTFTWKKLDTKDPTIGFRCAR